MKRGLLAAVVLAATACSVEDLTGPPSGQSPVGGTGGTSGAAGAGAAGTGGAAGTAGKAAGGVGGGGASGSPAGSGGAVGGKGGTAGSAGATGGSGAGNGGTAGTGGASAGSSGSGNGGATSGGASGSGGAGNGGSTAGAAGAAAGGAGGVSSAGASGVAGTSGTGGVAGTGGMAGMGGGSGSGGIAGAGGACPTGAPQPIVLATGQNNPPMIAIDATNVYWVTYGGGTVMKCALGGCNDTPTQIASGQVGAQGIAVGGSSVYWTQDAVWGCAIGGCGNAPTQLTPTGVQNVGIAVDANNVYATSFSANTVIQCAIAGCGNQPIKLATGQVNLSHIVVDSTDVYWATHGAIMKCAIGGCNDMPTQLASGQNGAYGIAVDATNVYWTEYTGGRVMKCAIGGCGNAPTVVASAQVTPTHVVVDATNVYWTTASTVMRCAISGCNDSPTTLASGQAGPEGIAVDASSVYWANGSTGTVVKLAKTSPSCEGLAATCGSCQDCCATGTVTGGKFNLGRNSGDPDFVPSGLTLGTDETPSAPATVSDYRLDTYEVTVGRFRKFVDAYDAWRAAGNPTVGSGKHAHLPSGGLNAGAETGWDTSWDGNLPATASLWASHLACDSTYQTWTPNDTGGHESRPLNCVSWYESYAFCIWDGGFLPSEAEWEYAAAGGNEERVFPWSTPDHASVAIDCSFANYYGAAGGTDYCVLPGTGSTTNVGTQSPKGNGKFGQADLAGNVYEWALDWYATYPASCNDCASTISGPSRVIRGGSYYGVASVLRAAYRSGLTPSDRNDVTGLRCARAP